MFELSGNRDSHPWRVMYSCTHKLQAGGTLRGTREHVGTSKREDAQRSVDYFRELASKGEYDPVFGWVHSTWIEYNLRVPVETLDAWMEAQGNG